jgi:serine/threonine protein kinase
MGEVFRARDARLDRTVAIKILPADFADNAELRIRFEREAITISQGRKSSRTASLLNLRAISPPRPVRA